MTTRVAHCRLCQSKLSDPVLDLGMLPPCNRFSLGPDAEERYPLAVAACPRCGLVQLSTCAAAVEVVPRVPWLRYSEPDGHLDALAEYIAPSIASAVGLGPFDGPLLTRLSALDKTVRQFSVTDAPAENGHFPYLETFQGGLRPERLAALAVREGQADLVMLRYLLEHSHDPVAALQAMRPLIAPGGMLLIEVPDSLKFLKRCDYSFIWEEHICYFTAETLEALAQRAGYTLAVMKRYEGPLEDALVALLRPIEKTTSVLPPSRVDHGFATYREAFAPTRDAYRAMIMARRSEGAEVAICGIGHQAIMFLNALDMQPLIAMMIDDDMHKRGKFASGATVPIMPSAAMLADTSIKVCLLAVHPRSEAKIKEKLGAFADRGGRFYSIFPGGETPTLVEAI